MSGNFYCCVCGKPATVCKKETINGVTRVSYYCDECLALLENGHPFDNLLSAMFNFGGSSYGNISKPKMRVCKCGMTEKDIISGGKFGCSECYKVFGDIAENYINSRGYLAHQGKKPHATHTAAATNSTAKADVKSGAKGGSQLEKLKAELALAVKEERFLDADKIAKQIIELNGEAK